MLENGTVLLFYRNNYHTIYVAMKGPGGGGGGKGQGVGVGGERDQGPGAGGAGTGDGVKTVSPVRHATRPDTSFHLPHG